VEEYKENAEAIRAKPLDWLDSRSLEELARRSRHAANADS